MSPEEHARSLVVSCLSLTQKVNDRVLQDPEFRKWQPATIAVVTVSLGAAFSRIIDLPRDEYLLLCNAAYDLIRPEEKGGRK